MTLKWLASFIYFMSFEEQQKRHIFTTHALKSVFTKWTLQAQKCSERKAPSVFSAAPFCTNTPLLVKVLSVGPWSTRLSQTEQRGTAALLSPPAQAPSPPWCPNLPPTHWSNWWASSTPWSAGECNLCMSERGASQRPWEKFSGLSTWDILRRLL